MLRGMFFSMGPIRGSSLDRCEIFWRMGICQISSSDSLRMGVGLALLGGLGVTISRVGVRWWSGKFFGNLLRVMLPGPDGSVSTHGS
jgi:hypothetical protein